MKHVKKMKQSLEILMFSVVAVVLLITVMSVLVTHIYRTSAGESYDDLHLDTLQIKKDINLQMISDRENLITMASFASKLHTDGNGYGMLFDSFKEMGLISEIGVLLPDNTYVTKHGRYDVAGKTDFATEVRKGEGISGKVKDFTDDDSYVVCSSAYIKGENGEPVGILYGIIELSDLRARYIEDVTALKSHLVVADSVSGDIIIDTSRNYLGNLTEYSTMVFDDGYSYDRFITDIAEFTSGFTAYHSTDLGESVYVHYAPLEFAKWHIMLMKPESVVFSGAKATGNYLAVSALVIIFIMVAYLFCVFFTERKKSLVSLIASDIRKNLLSINQQFDKIYDALRRITEFAGGRSTFVIDTYGEDYNYIRPEYLGSALKEEERKFLTSKLLLYVSKIPKATGNSVTGIRITPRELEEKNMPEFSKFFRKHGIASIYCSIVTNSSNNVSVIGVINPRNLRRTVNLLKEISVCLTMAIYNQKHLVQTETMAVSDALTGVSNRMSYKNDLKEMNKTDTSSLFCVYIDVNELNYFNNQYGHAAGDYMLVFVADTLKSKFGSEKLYRMGGDEFLIFSQNMTKEDICRSMDEAIFEIEEMKYHISVGICQGREGMSPEELVNEAEKAMYEEKAKYYQNKHARKIINLKNRKFKTDYTGIREIDAYMSVLGMRYFGVYCVTHSTDEAIQMLSPSYFSEVLEETNSFSQTLKRYIHDNVRPEYHRQMLSFVEYEALENLIETGITPSITYIKIDGEKVILSVYANSRSSQDGIDTVWTFEKVDDE